MILTPIKLNAYLMLKLPAAYICGVRSKHIDNAKCIVTVKHRWINKNPFKSMFWAVQGMAAELTTAALMISEISKSGKKISMLVLSNTASFTKKATGRITFVCNEGYKVKDIIEKAISTGEGQTVWMKSVGTNEKGIEVSTFNFEWTVRVKKEC